MNKKKTVLGIALLFTLVTGVFFLLTQLPNILFYLDNSQVKELFDFTLIWIILAVCMTLTLYILNRKQGLSLKDAFQNNIIRKTTGILTITNGLLHLPTVITVLISDLQWLEEDNYEFDKLCITPIVAYSVILLVIICQILFGLYLLRCHKQNASSEEERKSILGISLLFSLFAGIFSMLNNNGKLLSLRNIVWLIILIAVLAVLYILNRKQGKRLIELFKNNVIRKSTGALIIISGMFILPMAVLSLRNTIELYKTHPLNMGILNSNMLNNAIMQLVLISLLIIFGVYLLSKKAALRDNGGA